MVPKIHLLTPNLHKNYKFIWAVQKICILGDQHVVPQSFIDFCELRGLKITSHCL